MAARRGDTLLFERMPVIASHAAVGGKKEGEGPLAAEFDELFPDNNCGQANWETAEKILQLRAVRLCLKKAHATEKQVSLVLAGDLQAQCTASSYALRELHLPFVGLFGACSTMAEALGLGAALCSAGLADGLLAMTSSHFCAAERQFRTPLSYGAVRTPTAQWTATAAGCCILGAQAEGPYITHVTRGRIVDLGVTDMTNMGAAMAPAAFDTLQAVFRDTGTVPGDYDLILTGDLGQVGSDLLYELATREGVDLRSRHTDCGLLIYDRDRQDVHAGGSGCGCCASVLCSYILPSLREGRVKRVLFAATGALLSPTSTQQGESIPSIAHAVCLTSRKEDLPWN